MRLAKLGTCTMAVGGIVATMAIAAAAQTITVNVDKSQTFQTMEGNGFLDHVKPWKVKQGAFWVDADLTNFFDSLVNVVGVTMGRFFINSARHDSAGFSPAPGQYRITSNMREYFAYVDSMKGFAERENEPFAVIASVLTPPGYMKKNGATTSGVESTYPRNPENSLKEDQYDEFGDFCAAWIRTVADSFAIVPYGFSIQNEPYYNEPYSSCSYENGVHYGAVLKEVGPKVRALGLPTLLFGADHAARVYPNLFERAIHNDPEVAPYLDRNAVHGYVDGVRLDTTQFGRVQPTGGKPLWMSETGFRSEETSDHDGALHVARMLYGAYGRSNMSVWCHLNIMANESGSRFPGGFVRKEDGVPLPSFWTIAQFWRFIRPGMQRVAAISPSDSVYALAFKDDQVSSMSVILINNGTADHTLRLSISGGDAPPTFDVKRTTETEKFVFAGTVSSSENIELPARSIVSLGYNYIGTGRLPWNETEVAHRTVRAPTSVATPHAVRVYDLRGRLISRQGMARLTSGGFSTAAYCIDNGRQRSLVVAR